MKVSIITVTFNSALYLEETITSVLSQSYGNIEYIVVDGNSTDGTHEILKEYSNNISKIIIEDDDSMYEAINKGIMASTGDVIAILNSDDRIASTDAVKKIVETLSDDQISGCYSNVINCYGKEQIRKRVFNVTLAEYLASEKGTFIPHTSLYLKRHVFEDVGYYNLKYKYAADFEFIIRVLEHYNLTHIDEYLFLFRRHAGSITASGKIRAESRFILENNYKRPKFIPFKKLILWFKYYVRNMSVQRIISVSRN